MLVQSAGRRINLLPASDILFCLLQTFTNNLDPDQARHFVWPDLDPKILKLLAFLNKWILKKQQTMKKHAKLLVTSIQRVNP